jgi:putative ABC transport system permease protein
MVPFEIVGVIADYRMMSTGVSEPIVLHTVPYLSDLAPEYRVVVLYNILMKEIDDENVKALDEAIASVYDSYYKYKIIAYSDWIDFAFAHVKRMRDGMVVVASVVLLIAFIGLCGYLQGEMARRRKEIAVRKVSGASTAEVLVILGTRLLRIVLPATFCGVLVAVWLNGQWLSTLAQMRCSVPLWIYIAGALAVIAFVYAVQLSLSWHAANENPIEMIKRNN